MSRNYRLIVAPCKFDVLKTNICLFTKIFSLTAPIHPGIFLGRALWADSVSPRMNTIGPRDPFKPIRIGYNLAENNNPR